MPFDCDRIAIVVVLIWSIFIHIVETDDDISMFHSTIVLCSNPVLDTLSTGRLGAATKDGLQGIQNGRFTGTILTNNEVDSVSERHC